MKVSNEQLLQFIGQLYVENQLLGKRIDMQVRALQSHMADEHPAPDQAADAPEPEAV